MKKDMMKYFSNLGGRILFEDNEDNDEITKVLTLSWPPPDESTSGIKIGANSK